MVMSVHPIVSGVLRKLRSRNQVDSAPSHGAYARPQRVADSQRRSGEKLKKQPLEKPRNAEPFLGECDIACKAVLQKTLL
jgi:hypothetical protein